MVATTSEVVGLGDVPFALGAEDAPRANAISRLLASAPRRRPAQIVVRYLRRRPATPRRPPDHAYEGVSVWHDGDELIVQSAWGAGASVTPDRAWIGGEPDDLDAAWQQLFHYAVTHVLAHRHNYVVHAAGIVDVDGRAFVVLGDSGKGKSTLALAALTRGWRLLSDDLVIVRRAGDELEISGIPRRLALPGDLLATTDYESQPLADDARGRRELSAQQLTAGWFPAAGIVEVGHSDAAEGELRSLSSEKTLDRVLGSFSSVTDPLLVRQFFPVAAALTRLDSFWLGHGATVDTRLDVAGQLLTRCASRA